MRDRLCLATTRRSSERVRMGTESSVAILETQAYLGVICLADDVKGCKCPARARPRPRKVASVQPYRACETNGEDAGMVHE